MQPATSHNPDFNDRPLKDAHSLTDRTPWASQEVVEQCCSYLEGYHKDGLSLQVARKLAPYLIVKIERFGYPVNEFLNTIKIFAEAIASHRLGDKITTIRGQLESIFSVPEVSSSALQRLARRLQYRKLYVRDILEAPGESCWVQSQRQGRYTIWNPKLFQRHNVTFNHWEGIERSLIDEFAKGEGEMRRRYLQEAADTTYGFESFEFDARRALPGRPSIFERFASKVGADSVVHIKSRSKNSFPGPGVAFFAKAIDSLVASDAKSLSEIVVPSLQDFATPSQIEMAKTTHFTLLRGCICLDNKSLVLNIGQKKAPYVLIYHNSHFNGGSGPGMYLVPRDAVLVIDRLQDRSMPIDSSELLDLHLLMFTMRADRLGLPVFDLSHPVTPYSGMMHPIVIDRNLVAHTEFAGMAPNQWLAVSEVAKAYWGSWRYLQYALGFFKVSHRVWHTFSNGSQEPIDIMMSEVLAWHERYKTRRDLAEIPLLRAFPFHFRRGAYPSLNGWGEYSDELLWSRLPNMVIDPATLRILYQDKSSATPLTQEQAKIWLRAHGKQSSIDQLNYDWEKAVRSCIFEKKKGKSGEHFWTGLEPRFCKR